MAEGVKKTDTKKNRGDEEAVLVIITGASKGFGRAVACEAARTLRPSSRFLQFVLLSRDKAGLQQTAEAILKAGKEVGGASKDGDEIKVSSHQVDLSVVDDSLEQLLHKDVLQPIDVSKFSTVLLFLNHGSLGPPVLCHSVVAKVAALEFATNVSSFCAVSALLTSWLIEGLTNSRRVVVVRLINTSSLAAVRPMGSLGMYCAGKAAREMFMKVMALEFQEDPSILKRCALIDFKTLNWAPGPMKTKMVVDAVEDGVQFPQTAQFFAQMDSDVWVKPDDSASRLFSVLRKDTFKSGDSIDVYDVAQP